METNRRVLSSFGAKRGNLLGVTGRIQTRNYENQQGQRVYVTEVIADNVTFLESRSVREGRENTPDSDAESGQTNSNSYRQNDSDPFGGGSPINIDDDLPF